MARRPRKRHLQLELQKLDRKRDKNGQWRGGRRAGAGRKPVGERAGVPHRRRPYPNAEHPLHIVLRVRSGVARLRNGKGWRAVRRALTVTMNRHLAFRIVHFSLPGPPSALRPGPRLTTALLPTPPGGSRHR